jgi:hypothetical protein
MNPNAEISRAGTLRGAGVLIFGCSVPFRRALRTTTRSRCTEFEVGFYIFTAANDRYAWQWVGDHIRPRVRVPWSWHWPVGVSLSTEIGYQRAAFSPDTWTWEIRPIIVKQVGRWYLSFNPSVDRSFHGPSTRKGVEFSPNFKAGHDITKKINAGIEYYGALGPVNDFDPLRDQQRQIIPAWI